MKASSILRCAMVSSRSQVRSESPVLGDGIIGKVGDVKGCEEDYKSGTESRWQNFAPRGSFLILDHGC